MYCQLAIANSTINTVITFCLFWTAGLQFQPQYKAIDSNQSALPSRLSSNVSHHWKRKQRRQKSNTRKAANRTAMSPKAPSSRPLNGRRGPGLHHARRDRVEGAVTAVKKVSCAAWETNPRSHPKTWRRPGTGRLKAILLWSVGQNPEKNKNP